MLEERGCGVPYGVLHQDIFDSSLAVNLEARWVFQDMNILADAKDNVMMTPTSLALRIRAPLDLVERALEFLMREDIESKSSLAQGRRIQPLRNDMGGMIGYHMVNRHYYKRLMSKTRRREYQKVYRQKGPD